jgi:dTDP-4-dehydrorhamnose 3,5-epimerase/CDP-3, 6-dideoxy-D-glycero-D-glycero-4-hexulose-5-epimerase
MNSEFSIPGVFTIDLKRFEDSRGFFVKNFQRELLVSKGIEFETWECFYSSSQKDVIRGMHFQEPPQDQHKIVQCMRGHVTDVLLDLRKGETFGRSCSIELKSQVPQALFIPKGVAHGFVSREDESWMIYFVTTGHDSKCDRGVRWDSFGFDWKTESPIISERDQAHPSLGDYQSPFIHAATP